MKDPWIGRLMSRGSRRCFRDVDWWAAMRPFGRTPGSQAGGEELEPPLDPATAVLPWRKYIEFGSVPIALSDQGFVLDRVQSLPTLTGRNPGGGL